MCGRHDPQHAGCTPETGANDKVWPSYEGKKRKSIECRYITIWHASHQLLLEVHACPRGLQGDDVVDDPQQVGCAAGDGL